MSTNEQKTELKEPKDSAAPASEERRFDFDILYARYPNKEGKKRGFEKLKKTIKTEAEYRAFVSALDNYIKLCKEKDRIRGGFVKMWSTFVNNWTDYLEEISSTSTRSQLERIQKGEL